MPQDYDDRRTHCGRLESNTDSETDAAAHNRNWNIIYFPLPPEAGARGPSGSHYPRDWSSLLSGGRDSIVEENAVASGMAVICNSNKNIVVYRR